MKYCDFGVTIIHPRLQELVDSLEPDDNPVIFIVHLKK